jgi:hypothetical protein
VMLTLAVTTSSIIMCFTISTFSFASGLGLFS